MTHPHSLIYYYYLMAEKILLQYQKQDMIESIEQLPDRRFQIIFSNDLMVQLDLESFTEKSIRQLENEKKEVTDESFTTALHDNLSVLYETGGSTQTTAIDQMNLRSDLVFSESVVDLFHRGYFLEITPKPSRDYPKEVYQDYLDISLVAKSVVGLWGVTSLNDRNCQYLTLSDAARNKKGKKFLINYYHQTLDSRPFAISTRFESLKEKNDLITMSGTDITQLTMLASVITRLINSLQSMYSVPIPAAGKIYLLRVNSSMFHFGPANEDVFNALKRNVRLWKENRDTLDPESEYLMSPPTISKMKLKNLSSQLNIKFEH